jgi:hypothetical protein
MICDYAILKVTKYGIESIYESELKYELLDFFTKEFLCSHISNIDRKKVVSIVESIVPILHKKGFVLYKDNDTIYVLCKFWRRNCEKCSKYDWIPGKVYKIFNRRLCLSCAYEQLVTELTSTSDRVICKEDLLKQLLP